MLKTSSSIYSQQRKNEWWDYQQDYQQDFTMIGELSEELKGEQQIFRNLMSEKDVT